MGYDRGNSFLFDFKPNGNPFGSKSKGKLSPRSYPIQCERKWKYSFISVGLSIQEDSYIANKNVSPIVLISCSIQNVYSHTGNCIIENFYYLGCIIQEVTKAEHKGLEVILRFPSKPLDTISL